MELAKKKIHCLDEISSLVDRFKKTVGAKHNKELAELLGISDKDFSNRKGKGTISKLIIDWAISRRMDINNLVYGNDNSCEQQHENQKNTEEKRDEPSIPIRHEGIEGCCSFMRELIVRIATNPKNILLIAVSGDSMEPTMHNGETVMIDTGRTSIHEGGLFVLLMDGNSMIKRLSIRPGGKVRIISDNKEYESYETSVDNIQVVAQVIWIARQLIN